MDEIPLVLFTVKEKESTLLLDTYSQTDSLSHSSDITPREYYNYYHFYVSKYKNLNSINTQPTPSRNNNFNEKFDFINEKNNNFICCSNEFIAHKSNKLNQGLATLPRILCGNQIEMSPNNFELQNEHLKSFVNSRNSNLNSPFLNSDINYINLNSDPYLCSRNVYIRYPITQIKNIEGYYYNRELCNQCQYFSFRNADFNIDQPPKYNFISNTIPEALTMTIMIGVNAIVEVIAGFAVRFCAKIPDKDELHPGTGCVLIDYLNDKIDQLLIEQTETHNDLAQCSRSKNVTESTNINCESWLSNKLDEIMSPSSYKSGNVESPPKYNNLYDALIKNCYHKADESEFDPVEYSSKIPYTLPFGNRVQTLKRGFIDFN